jgi:hypothetical protein
MMWLKSDTEAEAGALMLFVESIVEKVIADRPDLSTEAVADEVIRRLPEEINRHGSVIKAAGIEER